jgi:dolichyl-phosphate beta-glucosyltransferase
MKNHPYISVILPAYNEVHSIGRTIGEIKAFFNQRGYTYEIIVSADGNDGTREMVTKMAQTDLLIRVIGSVERRGKGRGIRQGVDLANGDIIGFVDADNKTPITEFDKILPWLRDGYDVVIGSRGLRNSQIDRAQPFYRRLGSKGFAVFMHTIVGLNDIVDTQCGFKFFKHDVAVEVFRRQRIDGYMFDVEILYLAKQARYKIAQVPIRWHDDGDSRLDLFSGNLQNAIDVLRIRFNGAHEPNKPDPK